AEATGEQAEGTPFVGQGVRLELVEDLQPVLHGAQVDVRVREPATEIWGEVATLGGAEQRLQRATLAQPGIVAAVQQLQRLHEDLDFADASPPQLDVAGGGSRLVFEGAVDLALHATDGGHDAVVDPATIDDRAGELHEALPHPLVA